MQFIRTNLSPGMIVLLVILAILFAAVVIPLLVIGGFCWLVYSAITGSSPRVPGRLADVFRRAVRVKMPACQEAQQSTQKDPPAQTMMPSAEKQMAQRQNTQ